MKTFATFLTITLILLTTPVFALTSEGEATCEGYFSGEWFWQKSDSTITEKWEWKDLGSMYPYRARSGEAVDPASVFGRVTTSQPTSGSGTVGVSVNGSVSSPGYSLDLGFEFNIRSVWSSFTTTTRKSTTGSESTENTGTYTISGTGESKGVSGGGALEVLGFAIQMSGPISFSSSPPFNAPSPLVVTIEKDLPSAYECAHQNCEVALPNKYHHRVTCKEKVYLGLGSVIKVDCNDKYYACQTSTCPSDDDHIVPHACGHEDEKDEAWKHAQQASCSGSTTRNGSTVYCQSTNYYLCQHENHDFPSGSGSTNGGSTTGGSTNGGSITDNTPDCSYCTDGCSSCQPPPPPSTTVSCGRSACTASVSSTDEHRSSPCAAGDTYWTCNPGVNVSNWLNKHRVRTCRRSGCGQSWQNCSGGKPSSCLASSNNCWAQ